MSWKARSASSTAICCRHVDTNVAAFADRICREPVSAAASLWRANSSSAAATDFTMPSGNSTTTPPSRETSVKLSKAELESTDRVKIRLRMRKSEELTPPELQLAKSNYLVSPTSTVARLLSVVRKDCGLPTDTPRPLHSRGRRAAPLDLMLTADELQKPLRRRARRARVRRRLGAPLRGPRRTHPRRRRPATSRRRTAPAAGGRDDGIVHFLNPRSRGALLAELRPAHRGRVPAALYWAILLDVTAVGLVVPLLSRYSRELGGGPTFTGVLQATYGLTQLLGANLLGGLSDAKGRRPLLLTSELGGLVGYLCLAGSLHPALRPSGAALYFLLASRLPIGLFKQSLTVARALVADCTAPEGRMRAMSKLGAMVGCGFVLGPAFGGALSKIVASRRRRCSPRASSPSRSPSPSSSCRRRRSPPRSKRMRSSPPPPSGAGASAPPPTPRLLPTAPTRAPPRRRRRRRRGGCRSAMRAACAVSLKSGDPTASR